MKIQGIRTVFGAKQPLHEVFSRLPFDSTSEVVISYGHPGWLHGQAEDQSRDESDTLMEKYFEDPNIGHISIEGKYAFTKWENGAFTKYLKNLSFSESYLVWISEKNQEDTAYQFKKKKWSVALFAYEGQLFYEIFDKNGSMEKREGEADIEYPGDINGPGGIGIPT